MPLVRIDVEKGRTSEELRKLADTIQDVMLDVFAAPPRDRYQIITEHDKGSHHRRGHWPRITALSRNSDHSDLPAGQVERAEGRGVRRAGEAAGGRVRRAAEDLIVSVMANRHADWSFGLGRAQFLDGTLHPPI